MSDSKIQIKVGNVEFSGEGNQDWLSAQLDKVLEKVPDLLRMDFKSLDEGNGSNSGELVSNVGNSPKPSNLATFLREKSANNNQTKKFLATAAYLQLNGRDSLSTYDITKCIDEAKQGKLTNPALCLIGNTKKGYCDKKGKNFYVTPQGFASLGINTD